VQYRCAAPARQLIDFYQTSALSRRISCNAPGWHKHCYSKAIQGGASLTWEPGGDDLRPDKSTTSIAKEGVLQATHKPKTGKKPVRPDFVAAAKTLRPKQEN
jgi:hypothetical protein